MPVMRMRDETSRSWRDRKVVVAMAAAITVVVACSSEEFTIAQPAPFPDDFSIPPPDATSANAFLQSPCGYDPPDVGSDCSQARSQPVSWNGQCFYGHDSDDQCNEIFECNGTWRRLTPASCFKRCPAAFDDITPGAVCDNKASFCSYLEGTCACVADSTMADAGADGDADAGKPARHWKCAPPPKNGCPAQRPPLKSDCVREMVCDYGSCILGISGAFKCSTSRTWIQASVPDCSEN